MPYYATFKAAFFLFLLVFAGAASSTWINQVNISSGACGTPYCQYKIPIPAGKINPAVSNGSDLIVYNSTQDGRLGYWLWDDWNYTSASGNLSVNASNNTPYVYLYYNTGNASSSNIHDVNPCADDFDGASVNTSLWLNGAGSLSGGILTESVTTVANRLRSTCTNIQNVTYEYRFKANSGEAYFGADNSTDALSNIVFQKSGQTQLAINGSFTTVTTLNESQWYRMKYFNPSIGNSTVAVYYDDGGYIANYSNQSDKKTQPEIEQFVAGTSNYDYLSITSYFQGVPAFTISSAYQVVLNNPITVSAVTSPVAVSYSYQNLQGRCTATSADPITSLNWTWYRGEYSGQTLIASINATGTIATPISGLQYAPANITNATFGTYWQFACSAYTASQSNYSIAPTVQISSLNGVLSINQLLNNFFQSYFTIVISFFIVGVCFILIGQVSGTLIAAGILFIIISFITSPLTGDTSLPLIGLGSFILGLAMKFATPGN